MCRSDDALFEYLSKHHAVGTDADIDTSDEPSDLANAYVLPVHAEVKMASLPVEGVTAFQSPAVPITERADSTAFIKRLNNDSYRAMHCAKLAAMHYFGFGTFVDYECAFAWAQHAVDGKDLYGAVMLAHLYSTGRGTQTDLKAAAEFTKMAKRLIDLKQDPTCVTYKGDCKVETVDC